MNTTAAAALAAYLFGFATLVIAALAALLIPAARRGHPGTAHGAQTGRLGRPDGLRHLDQVPDHDLVCPRRPVPLTVSCPCPECASHPANDLCSGAVGTAVASACL
jgi:hypothetical protein